jgi:HNH endonuclease
MARPAAPTGTRTVASDGYVRVELPGHPFAVDGWVREHVLVLYAQLGPGEHRCDGCGRALAWGSTLEVDHLDGDRSNNAAANLVAVCRGCNNRRRGDRVRKNAGAPVG